MKTFKPIKADPRSVRFQEALVRRGGKYPNAICERLVMDTFSHWAKDFSPEEKVNQDQILWSDLRDALSVFIDPKMGRTRSFMLGKDGYNIPHSGRFGTPVERYWFLETAVRDWVYDALINAGYNG